MEMVEQLFVKVARLFNYRVRATTTGNTELLCVECAEGDFCGEMIWSSFRKTSLDGSFDFSILELIELITAHEGLVHNGPRRPDPPQGSNIS